jgi:hypothetical protein
MKDLEFYSAQLQQFISYIQYCSVTQSSAPACKPFWTMVVILGLVLALVIVMAVTYKLIKTQLDYIRNWKRIEARKVVADAETMRKYQWQGDDLAPELSQEEIAAAIRTAKLNEKA